MQTSLLLRTALSIIPLAAFAGAAPAFAAPAKAHTAPPAPAPANYLTATQYHIGTVSYRYNPALRTMTRRRMTAWHIEHGRWNGQKLGGLRVVLVQKIPNGILPRRSNVLFISLQASRRQRRAVLNAIRQARPDLFRAVSPDAVRVEPAFIELKRVQSGAMVLRLGKVA